MICMTGMLKSPVVIHLGKMKRGERVENDTSCQKWHYLFPSADSVEAINVEGLWVNLTGKVQSTSWDLLQVTILQGEARCSAEYLSIMQEE